MSRFVIAVVAFLLFAAPAQARHPRYLVPLPPHGWTVRYDAAVASGISPAGADVERATVVMARPLQPYTFAHEVGHIFDWQVLTEDDRAYFAGILHVPATDWWGTGGGAEAFADYYAAAVTGRTDINIYVQVIRRRLLRFDLALLGIMGRDGLHLGRVELR